MTTESADVATVDHVGLTVTDLDASIAWYQAVFGLSVVQGPHVIGGAEERVGDIFGPGVGDFLIVYMGSGSGPRLQLFQFLQPPVERRTETFEFWRTGISHLSLTCVDVPASVARLEAHGGKRRSGIHGALPGPIYCYCEDPDGNVIELITAVP
ncbi:MAG TPA: VOC family protein [Acidothermaceae bacterium]|jgi:catechol 2,3-dioxygenase-like lactoylglutathione lyase family enzyme|nr:VOC family protein [Acidothermaceae bacterium]